MKKIYADSKFSFSLCILFKSFHFIIMSFTIQVIIRFFSFLGMAGVSGTHDAEEFGVEVAELRDLMECRGYEACQRIQNEHGGVHNLCRKLHTSPTDGKFLHSF